MNWNRGYLRPRNASYWMFVDAFVLWCNHSKRGIGWDVALCFSGRRAERNRPRGAFVWCEAFPARSHDFMRSMFGLLLLKVFDAMNMRTDAMSMHTAKIWIVVLYRRATVIWFLQERMQSNRIRAINELRHIVVLGDLECLATDCKCTMPYEVIDSPSFNLMAVLSAYPNYPRYMHIGLSPTADKQAHEAYAYDVAPAADVYKLSKSIHTLEVEKLSSLELLYQK